MLAFLVAHIGTLLLVSGRLPFSIPDHPNARSLHARVTPRSGGLAIMAAVLAAWGMIPGADWVLLATAGIVFASSLRDDLCGLGIQWRLLSQFAAAGGLVFFSLPDLQAPWLAALVLFGMVWSCNLFNFMDGSDGLAGGMAVSGFLFYGLAALAQGNAPIAMESFGIAAAALAFLWFNFQPAKIFMGDAGAIPLGFLGAGLGLQGWMQQAWPGWFPFLVFFPFIADSGVTLLKRTIQGENPLKAHRSHYYQRMILMGWSHKKLALWAYAWMIATGGSAMAGLASDNPLALFAFWLCLTALVMTGIDLKWRKSFQNQPESIE